MGTRAGLSRKWHFSWEWTTRRSWQCEDPGEYLQGDSLERESLRNTKGWTGWSIMGEAEMHEMKSETVAIMQVLRGHGERFSLLGENQRRILSEGLVWFTFQIHLTVGENWLHSGRGWRQGQREMGSWHPQGWPIPDMGCEKRGQNPVLTLGSYQSQMEGGGFRWSSQASVLDSVAMAGRRSGNITEQA